MRTSRALACALLVSAVAAGCGNVDEQGATDPSQAPNAETTGAWLLRFNTAEGADGATSRGVYVTLDPASGTTTVKRMPRVLAGSSYGAAQALLVSADHAWSLADTTVGREGSQGRVVLYATAGTGSTVVPVRAWSGSSDLRPVAAAFDPAEPGLLRVVDSAHRIWKVDVDARTSTAAGTLPLRTGWIYGNGFDPNSGEPYIEAVDTEATLPPGNGDADVRPVEREGGQVLTYDGTDLPGLPALPCGFAGGFTDAEGTSWVFCADTPRITTYRVEKGGQEWKPFGKPTTAVVPAAATELAVVLPPS